MQDGAAGRATEVLGAVLPDVRRQRVRDIGKGGVEVLETETGVIVYSQELGWTGVFIGP